MRVILSEAGRRELIEVDTIARTPRKFDHQDILYALASCATLLCCVLIARPYAHSGFIDDWSYSHVALELARTGRVHYNGWGSPTLLFQSLWASVWIRIFGFSFDLLRNITLPFSCGFVVLMYSLGRQSGLRHSLAFFGSLLVGTSPLFVPVAASFMTDPYGCFFTTACLCTAVAVITSSELSRQIYWLWALVIVGILGGSDRQIVWIAPLSLIPYLAWKRRSRIFWLHAVLAFAVCLGCLAAVSYYFRPPYAVFDLDLSQLALLLRHEFRMTLGRMLGLLLTCAMLAAPALVCLSSEWKKLGCAPLWSLVLGSVVCTFFLAAAFSRFAVAPFLGDLLSPYGILWQGEDMLGLRTAVLPVWLRLTLTAAVLFITAMTAIAWRRLRVPEESPARGVFAVFLLFSVPPLLPGALLNLAYDRYVLPILPVAVVAVLYRFQTMQRRMPVIAWVTIGAFAYYSVAATRDYYARLQARTSLAATLKAAGISADSISAGLEHDGWARLERTGNIASTRRGEEAPGNASDTFWFWYFTRIHPKYIICYSEQDPHAPLERSFALWLSPLRKGFVYVKERK